MAQVKIYGNAEFIQQKRHQISEAIHKTLMSAFGLPPNKKFQRFFPLSEDDFVYPSDRSWNYIIIEILIFAGRSAEAKKKLILNLYDNLFDKACISKQDIEITIYETPIANWGIRGLPGDELELDYNVKV